MTYLSRKVLSDNIDNNLIAISNSKHLLLNVFHDLTPDYLQNYLNEFCHKFNLWYFGDAMFDRLMVAAISYKNDFGYNIA